MAHPIDRAPAQQPTPIPNTPRRPVRRPRSATDRPAPIVEPFGLLVARLLREGWHEGVPPWVEISDLRIDADCLREMVCGECSHRRMAYRALHQPAEKLYKAFAVCGVCQHVVEF